MNLQTKLLMDFEKYNYRKIF